MKRRGSMRSSARALTPRERRAAERRRMTREAMRCRVCGCTELDCRGCVERTGEPCYWKGPNVCSACVRPCPSCEGRNAHRCAGSCGGYGYVLLTEDEVREQLEAVGAGELARRDA